MSDAAEDPGTAHVGELQLHLRPILDLKPLAHANYSLVRDVDLDKMAPESPGSRPREAATIGSLATF